MSGDPVDEAVRLLDESAGHREAGRLARARQAAERALEILRSECGPDHPDVANALLSLGACREDEGQFSTAEGEYRRAAAIMAGYVDAPDEVVQRLRVKAQLAVGRIERIQGRLDDACSTLTAALAVATECLGPDDLDTAAALNDLGIVCKYAGRFEEGEVAYRQALAIVETTAGPDSPDAASIWHNLGGLAFDAGAYDVAEAPARRAVELREAALGPEHPDVAADVAALAAIVDALGRTDEAEALYRRALAVFDRSEGADYDLAVLHNNMGVLAAARGDATAAEQHYRAALDMKQRLLAPDHPDVAMTLQNLGMLTGDRELVERALAIFEAALDPDHPKIAGCRAALSALA